MYSIFEEADKIIDEDKRAEYGSIEDSFNKIARMWSVIIGVEIDISQVALCMIAFKLCRESFKHKPDNLVDICGYTKCLGKLEGIKE